MARGGRVRTVSVRVTANISDLEKKMKSVSAKMRRTAKSMHQAGATMTKAFTVPVAAATAALIKSTSAAMSYADEIDKMAVRTGMSTDRLQELKFVTDQVGVSFEAIEKTVGSFTRRITTAQKGTGETAEVFKKLSIQIRDNQGQLRPLTDLYDETITKLSNLNNETEQSVMASQLFGRQYMEILPILRAGGDEIERLSQRFRDLGGAMDAETIQKYVQLKDRLAELRTAFQAVAMNVASQFLPTFEKIGDFVENKVLPAIRKIADWFSKLNQRTLELTGGFSILLAAIGPLLMGAAVLIKIFAGVTLASIKVIAIAGAIVVAFVALGKTFVTLYKQNEQFRNAVQNAWDGLKNAAKTTVEFIQKLWAKWGERITIITEKALSIVVEVATNAFNVLGNVFNAVANLLTGNWSGLWDNIKNILAATGKTIVVVAGSIASTFLGVFQKMAEHTVDRVFGWMVNKVTDKLNQLISVANRVRQLLGFDAWGEVKVDWRPSDAIGNLRASIDEIVDKFKITDGITFDKLKSSWEGISSAVEQTSNNMDLLEDSMDTTSSGVDKLREAVASFVSEYDGMRRAFRDTFGLFDRMQRQATMTGTRWIRNLTQQVRAMQTWEDTRDKIRRSGDISEPLRERLLAKGPDQAAQLDRLMKSLSPEQWRQASELEAQRMGIASAAAQQQMGGTLPAGASQIIFNITGNELTSERQIDSLVDKITGRLKTAGLAI